MHNRMKGHHQLYEFFCDEIIKEENSDKLEELLNILPTDTIFTNDQPLCRLLRKIYDNNKMMEKNISDLKKVFDKSKNVIDLIPRSFGRMLEYENEKTRLETKIYYYVNYSPANNIKGNYVGPSVEEKQ